jgi:hypothetical protein
MTVFRHRRQMKDHKAYAFRWFGFAANCLSLRFLAFVRKGPPAALNGQGRDIDAHPSLVS